MTVTVRIKPAWKGIKSVIHMSRIFCLSLAAMMTAAVWDLRISLCFCDLRYRIQSHNHPVRLGILSQTVI